MTHVLYLLIALALAVACGVFVAAEFSLTTVDRAALDRAAERGERGAASAREAVRRLTFHLSGAQLGITVTGLVIGMLAEPAFAALLTGPLRRIGLGSAAGGVALVLGTLFSAMGLMVLGELVPKSWAISRPLAVARAVAAPQRAFSTLFRPLIAHLNATANRIVRRVGLTPPEELATARGPRELEALARHSARRGALEADTAELFVRTLGLADLTAENVMTPRVRVTALDAESTAADVAEATRATGLSRFPVHRGGLDTVIGVVHVKDALAVPAGLRDLRPVTDLMRQPVLVPESLPVERLLDRLTGEQSMAVVIDEYGGTAGVATLEDIVEEVVGEVWDEHDRVEGPDLVFLGENAEGRRYYEADGACRTDQVEEIGMWPPQGPYETLAGLVAQRLGRIPSRGDEVRVAGWRLEVTDDSGHRAARLRLTSPPPDARAPAEAGHGGGGEGSGDGGGGKEGGR